MANDNKSHLESLTERLAKLQKDIEVEQGREAIEARTTEIQEAVRAAITPLIGELPKTHGVWVNTNSEGSIMVSILQVRDDGMPKAQQTRSGSTASNGNGFIYTLEDERTFDTCEDAVNALGIETRDAKGEWLEGKKYYGRLDRLPKEVASKITKSEKPKNEGDGDGDGGQNATSDGDGDGEQTEQTATSDGDGDGEQQEQAAA